MEIVTGFQGKNHVTAQQLSRLISGLAGDETYVLDTQDQLAIEVVSANKVTIATGDLIAQGTYFTNEAPEDLVIENGVTGLNRNDLIVCRYEKAEPAVDEDGNPDYTIPRIESGDWAVVKGTPSSGTPEDPSVVTASLQDPNTSLAEFPVYRIPIRGLSVGTPERIPPVIPSMREACDSLEQTRTRVAFYTNAITFQAHTSRVVISPEQLRNDLGLNLDAKGTFVPVCESGDLVAYSGGFMAAVSLRDGATIQVPVSQVVRYRLWVIFIPD